MAVSEAAKEALYLKNILCELTGIEGCVTLFNDNMGAQKLALNLNPNHKRTKHIDIRHHFIRDVVSEGQVRLEYLRTENMPADVLTKSLCAVKHNKFIVELGMSKIGSV